jgi:hypothetical protein
MEKIIELLRLKQTSQKLAVLQLSFMVIYPRKLFTRCWTTTSLWQQEAVLKDWWWRLWVLENRGFHYYKSMQWEDYTAVPPE